MKNITILFMVIFANFIYAQDALDYNSKLNYYKGISVIDGSQINPNTRFTTIEADFITFSERSALTFVNCIVKVNGKVDASSPCVIRLVNSYIICRSYNGPRSDRIIRTKNFDYSPVSEIVYIQKIKGNPVLEIIDRNGRVVVKGSKKSISNKKIKPGIYDVRSAGNFYDSNVLLASR